MPPIVEDFRASVHARRHMLAKHDVEFVEAAEAAESTERQYRTYSDDADERRYVVPGKTTDGRRLWVVFADEGDRCGRIITAFEPTDRNDRARHRRMRGD
jgi:uncharacterized DUF497 family protein